MAVEGVAVEMEVGLGTRVVAAAAAGAAVRAAGGVTRSEVEGAEAAKGVGLGICVAAAAVWAAGWVQSSGAEVERTA